MTNNDKKWQQHITDFLGYLEIARQLSPHTLTNYRRDLEKFSTFCEHNNIDQPSKAHSADVRQWVAHLHRKGLSGSSLQRALSALRSFYKFRSREGEHHKPGHWYTSAQVRKKITQSPRHRQHATAVISRR